MLAVIWVLFGLACIVSGALCFWAILHGGTRQAYPTYTRPEDRYHEEP